MPLRGRGWSELPSGLGATHPAKQCDSCDQSHESHANLGGLLGIDTDNAAPALSGIPPIHLGAILLP